MRLYDKLRRWLGRPGPPTPLRGAPAVRRLKTYSASSGYVFQYYYLGRRETDSQEGLATEYVFEVQVGAGAAAGTRHVSVVLPEQHLDAWAKSQNRELADNERYAVAKLALFQAFDDGESPHTVKPVVYVSYSALDRIAAALDF